MAQSELVMERPKRVCQRLGIGLSQYYEDREAGLIPVPVKLGKRAVGHPAHETDAILQARMASASDHQIRQLVRDLLVARRDHKIGQRLRELIAERGGP